MKVAEEKSRIRIRVPVIRIRNRLERHGSWEHGLKRNILIRNTCSRTSFHCQEIVEKVLVQSEVKQNSFARY
jgi:hypothetical protein